MTFAPYPPQFDIIFDMEFTDNIIVLLRQHFRESDRITSVYSLEHGRINLRFPGVNKSASRLKAISEPFSCSCARIYIKTNASIGCVTGGKLITVYPSLRADYKKTELALHFCDLMYRLTPEEQPNPDKFSLLHSSLMQLDKYEPNYAFAPAFLLRLMQLGGFGLLEKPVLDIPQDFWQKMHTAPLNELAPQNEEELVNINKSRYVCQRFLNRYLNYPLRTIEQLESTPIEAQTALQETALEPALAY